LRSDLKATRREQCETLLGEEARALELLTDYETRALAHLRGVRQRLTET
jgi:hypothetical protein